MSFVSWGYYALLAAALILYWLLPHRLRWGALLLASGIFCYLLGADCLVWLAAATLVSYGLALFIGKARKNGKKGAAKGLLILALVLCFGMLIAFKYVPFFISIIDGVFGLNADAAAFSLAQPIGISFYIFQITGYLIDVYRGKIEPVRHAGKYALAISFFPKVMQGPIEPVPAFIGEINEKRAADPLDMRLGAVTALVGIFKKVMIADRLAAIADAVFKAAGESGEISALTAVLGAVAYAFQLYADFSGYTDIALGSARMFGLKLTDNFRRPYLSRSIGEFWRRWHITLSNWLRDYVYIPLGGSRVKRPRWAFNVMVVFLLSGLWHGADFTFVIWGLLHGAYQVIGKFTSPLREKLRARLPRFLTACAAVLSVILTFILVDFAWIFFRAPDLSAAFKYVSLLFSGDWLFSLAQLGVDINEAWMSAGVVLALIVCEIIGEKRDLIALTEKSPLPVRWAIYLILLFAIILFGFYGNLTASSFIYVGF